MNREVRDLEGQLNGLPHHADVGTEPVSVTDLLDEQEKAQAHKQANDRKRQALEKAHEQVDRLAAQTHELEQRLAILRVQSQEAKQEVDRLAAEVGGLVDPSEAEIERIRQAGEHNERVRQNQQRAEASASREHTGCWAWPAPGGCSTPSSFGPGFVWLRQPPSNGGTFS